ncbi:hypothetical protein V1506DRAFT_530680 [Lipomyces tetrasporus]
MAWVEDDSYQRALNFLKDNEPERRLDIRLSHQAFRALEAQACGLYDGEKFPRIDYSASDSRATIYTAPSVLHGSAAAAVQTAISCSVLDGLLRHNKQELINCIMPLGASTYESVDEQGRGSTKTSDGGLKYHKNGRKELVVMIQVGVSDGYSHLKSDIMVWLHEFHCRSAILLWLNERPRFSFPSQESDSAYAPTQSAMFANAMAQNRRNTPFGPYLFNGHNWFGTLNTAFIEVYQRDLATDSILPVQKYASA